MAWHSRFSAISTIGEKSLRPNSKRGSKRGGAKRRPAYKPQKYLAVQRPLGIHKGHSVSRTLPAQHNELGTRTHDFGKAGTRKKE